MLCPDCKGQMKPLFTGFFCPNDCDRRELKLKLKQQIADAHRVVAKPRNWGGWGKSATYTPKTGQCPDTMCRAMGTQTHDSYQQNGAGVTTAQRYYKCNLCNKSFKEDLDVATHPLPGMAP